jgi:N-acylethanolamine-hydrolysing acid amidase
MIKSFAESYASQVTPSEMSSIITLLKNGYLNPELASELSALATTVNITFNDAVFLNFMYEWNAYCTSIVVRLTNGTVIHGRNLDYQSSQFLSETAVQIRVFQGNEYLYTSTGFAWYLGVGTGIGRGFSVSLNQRDAGGRNATLEALEKGYPGDLWVLRKAFTNLDSYWQASYYLSASKVAASTYYAVAGISEGSVLTRDRDRVAGLESLNETNWFVVQCNSDYWTPDPDGRRTTAINSLISIGQENMTIENLLKVLQTPPVINPTTVFTTLMVPSTGYLNTTIYVS